MSTHRISAYDFFKKGEALVDPRGAGIYEAVAQFVIDGADEAAFHYVILKGVAVMRPGHHDSPEVVISTTLYEWIQLLLGKIGPFRAYLSGRVEVEGDIVLAQQVLKMFKTAFLLEQDFLTYVECSDVCARAGMEECA